MNAFICKLIIAFIKVYRFVVSPWLGNHCRFHPTCSSYAIDALQQHGAVRGGWLAVKRISSCHPWHQGGMDPVPGKSDLHG